MIIIPKMVAVTMGIVLSNVCHHIVGRKTPYILLESRTDRLRYRTACSKLWHYIWPVEETSQKNMIGGEEEHENKKRYSRKIF